MVCLHATDPATVFLSGWARVDDLSVADAEQALYDDRTLVKHLAMRRTIFLFPLEVLPFAQAAASNRVAATERKRLIREVEGAGLRRDGARWLNDASKRVLAALADGREATSSELRDEIPLLAGGISYGAGKSWGGTYGVGPRVLTVLSARGLVVRASNNGPWYVSRPRWARTESWLGAPIAAMPEREGTAAAVAAWLRAFGPGTLTDIKWWLGSTVKAVRLALADVDAVEVGLDGANGYVLPDDDEEEAPVAPWAALLPPLDPTTMGWIERDWYLGPHKPQLVDSTGNAGSTAWWGGRIVGGWRQRDDGSVELQLLESVGRDGQRALRHEAERLTEWFAGQRVLPRFPSPLWNERSA
jgi:hypothetical protein